MEIDIKYAFFHQLAPVPTSVFKDNEDNEIKIQNESEAEVDQSSRTLPKHETNVVDGCAIMLIIQFSRHCTVQYYVNNVLEYVF